MNDISRLLNWNLLFSFIFLKFPCNALEGSSGFGHGQGQPFHQCPLGQWWVNHLLSYTLPSALQGIGRAVIGNSLVLRRYHMACRATRTFPKGYEMSWAYWTLSQVVYEGIHPSGQLLRTLLLWIALAKFPPPQVVGSVSSSMLHLGALGRGKPY